MFTHRSLVGWIKGLRYAVRLNDFKLAQRLRMALTATPRHIDEPVRDEVARLVDISGLWLRNIGDRHKRKREIDRLARDIVPHLGRGRNVRDMIDDGVSPRTAESEAPDYGNRAGPRVACRVGYRNPHRRRLTTNLPNPVALSGM